MQRTYLTKLVKKKSIKTEASSSLSRVVYFLSLCSTLSHKLGDRWARKFQVCFRFVLSFYSYKVKDKSIDTFFLSFMVRAVRQIFTNII